MGKLGGKWYFIFGDMLWVVLGVIDMFFDLFGFYGMVWDFIFLFMDDLLMVVDFYFNDDELVLY